MGNYVHIIELFMYWCMMIQIVNAVMSS